MRANFVAHGADGVTEALGAVQGMLQQHAAMLSFVEAFFVKGSSFPAEVALPASACRIPGGAFRDSGD
jgi:hypothetical protein